MRHVICRAAPISARGRGGHVRPDAAGLHRLRRAGGRYLDDRGGSQPARARRPTPRPWPGPCNWPRRTGSAGRPRSRPRSPRPTPRPSPSPRSNTVLGSDAGHLDQHRQRQRRPDRRRLPRPDNPSSTLDSSRRLDHASSTRCRSRSTGMPTTEAPCRRSSASSWASTGRTSPCRARRRPSPSRSAASRPSTRSTPDLLPIVLDTDDLADDDGRDRRTDQYTYNSSTNTVTSGAGRHLRVEALSGRAAARRATGARSTSASRTTARRPSATRSATGSRRRSSPRSPTARSSSTRRQSPPSITFSGNPGISAGIKDDLTAIIGKPVVVPIYDQNGGNGNNAWYRVIAFQPAPDPERQFPGQSQVRDHPALPGQRPDRDRGTAQSWTRAGRSSRLSFTVTGSRILVVHAFQKETAVRKELKKLWRIALDARRGRHRSAWRQSASSPPDQVEEDWQVVIAEPDPLAVGPQITTIMSPNSDPRRLS